MSITVGSETVAVVLGAAAPIWTRVERWAETIGPRPTVRVFGGPTERDPIEDASLAVDLDAGEGSVVAGYMAPEHDEMPPCCCAPVPRGV